MTGPINNSLYADFEGLAALRRDAKAHAPDSLQQVARQFEGLFTQMLLKSVREANQSFGDSMFDSNQQDFYQSMFDDQMAMHLSQGRGLGLADMLVQQLQGVAGAPAPQGSGLEARDSGRIPTAEKPIGDASSTPDSVFPKPQASGPLTSSKFDFIREMLPHAEAAAREIGVDPSALLAQAALETGWGKSVPAGAGGECSFNMFGIKAGGQWSGAAVNVPTLEFADGVAVRKVERFRSYESAAASFRDYAQLIGNSARYERAVGSGDNVTAFAAALQQGGYATDPEYARKLIAVAGEVKTLSVAQTLGSDGQIKSADDAPIASYAGVRT